MRLIAEPLTPEAFAPFGQVLEVGTVRGSSANQGTAMRYDFAARLASTREAARQNLCVFRVAPRALPLELALVERHPCSTQAFIPMVASRYLVVVCPSLPDGSPAIADTRAFLCGPDQGINYDVGVWHHPMAALDAEAQFAMLVWEDGTARDCEQVNLAAPRPLVVEGV